MSYTPRLQEKYRSEIVAALTERMGYKNIMQVPKLEKICINQGVGEATTDKKLVDVAIDEMTRITGQKSVSYTF
jgi:large subunit ribosomal protein L5